MVDGPQDIETKLTSIGVRIRIQDYDVWMDLCT